MTDEKKKPEEEPKITEPAKEKQKFEIEDITEKEPADLDIDSAVAEDSEEETESQLEETVEQVDSKLEEKAEEFDREVEEAASETEKIIEEPKEKKSKLKKIKKSKGEKSRKWLKIVAIVIVTALVTGAAVLGAMYYLNQNQEEEQPVEETPVVTEEPEVEEEGTTVFINSEVGLNMRAEPDTASKVLAIIPFGTEILVLAEENGWIKTEYEDQEGWVSADFTTTESPYIYTNNTEGFTLTMDSDWVGWKVFEDNTDWGSGVGTAKTYYFALPTTDKNWSEENVDAGYASFFAVTVMTEAQWTKVQATEGPKPSKLGESSSGKVIVWSSGQAAPSDLTARFDEIKSIIDTFETI